MERSVEKLNGIFLLATPFLHFQIRAAASHTFLAPKTWNGNGRKNIK